MGSHQLARELMQEIAAGPALDAALIGAMQKTEHYCIAAWGTVKALGTALEQESAVRIMERAMQEGGKFDQKLTELAEEDVTPASLAEELDAEESDGELGNESDELSDSESRDRSGKHTES